MSEEIAMTLRYRIIKILELGPRHVREICCLLNGKSYDFCWNIDGRGGHCKYWYKRPKREKQRIKLVKPPCKHNPLYILRILKELEKEGVVLRQVVYKEDPFSKWGKDRFVYYSLVHTDKRALVR